MTHINQPNALIDIGVNLSHASFDEDIDSVIERAQAAGVSAMIVTGTDLDQSLKAHQLSLRYPGLLFSTAGIHPHDAKDFTATSMAQLKQLAKCAPVVAIGESGLDFNRLFSTKEQQIHAFEQHIELAIELQMPLFLHERDAHQCQWEILHQYRDQLSEVVIHCFTGSQQQAFSYLDLNCSLGITGWICDERRGQHLHAFIGAIPLSQLMIETDAPYLMPRVKPRPPLTSKRRNEPCTLPYILEEIAKHSPHSVEHIARTTTANARRFFRLDQ